MPKNLNIDYTLLGIVAGLIFLGIVMISTVSAPLSLEKFGNTWHYSVHQLLFAIIPGLLLGFLFFKIPLSVIKKYTIPLLLLNLIALILVFVPKIGVSLNNSSRWISLGPILFQPSEFLKITFLIYISAWLSRKKSEKKTAITFFVILSIVGVFLIKQPDMGTLMIIVAFSIFLYLITPTSILYKVLIFAATGILAILMTIFTPYRMQRLMSFLHPEMNPLKENYQINQSLMSIGSGKILGINPPFGLGTSQQKFGFLPNSMSDSIFAIIGEEMGFIGCIIIVLLFLLLLWRGLKIAQKCSDKFLYLLASGIVIWLVMQSFFNIGAVTSLLPLTGIPLPFISYGGSHIIVEMIGIGILLNISKK